MALHRRLIEGFAVAQVFASNNSEGSKTGWCPSSLAKLVFKANNYRNYG